MIRAEKSNSNLIKFLGANDKKENKGSLTRTWHYSRSFLFIVLSYVKTPRGLMTASLLVTKET